MEENPQPFVFLDKTWVYMNGDAAMEDGICEGGNIQACSWCWTSCI